MNSISRTLAFMIVLAAFQVGCWKQGDTITINLDGTTTFKSNIEITENGLSVSDIDELTSAFMEELRTAGWQLERKWVSQSEPFKLSFSGRGNIHKISSDPDFYTIQKIDEKTYRICFIPAEAEGRRSSRSIKFAHGLESGSAKVVDEQGKEVKEIANVLENRTYTIVF